jgi:protein tyrosine/serine phosphatase
MKASFPGRWRATHAARYGAIALVVLLLLGGAYLAELQLTGNFHTVIRGQIYRSGQPTAAHIAEYANE